MSRKICLILGSNSDIGQAIAYRFAVEGFDLLLASRNPKGYQERLAADLETRHGIKAVPLKFDGSEYDTHKGFCDELQPFPDVVISAFGYLGDNKKSICDFAECRRIIDSNLTGHVSILNNVAQKMKALKNGSIMGISSVAGERGRAGNLIYGSAKAAFSTYIDGLRNYLFSSGVHVGTIKPGYVRTKMIEGQNTPRFLTATPDQAAKAVWKAYKGKRSTVYILARWRLIMFILKLIPEFIFKRLSI